MTILIFTFTLKTIAVAEPQPGRDYIIFTLAIFYARTRLDDLVTANRSSNLSPGLSWCATYSADCISLCQTINSNCLERRLQHIFYREQYAKDLEKVDFFKVFFHGEASRVLTFP